MWMASIRCNFIKFTATSGTSEPISYQLGIWYYQWWSTVISSSGTYVFESCHGYPDAVTIDDSWKSARAFSVIAFVLSIIMIVAACVSACATNTIDYDRGHTRTQSWAAPVYLLLAISEGLTLLLLNSNACKNNIFRLLENLGGLTFPDTCSLATGGKLAISSTAFWAAAAVSSFLAHSAEKKEIAEEVGAGLRAPLTASDMRA